MKPHSKNGILSKLMPAIQRSEFALALNQVSNERGLDSEVVLETVRNAILAAYRKDHPEAVIEEYTALLDANTGEAKILHKDEDVTPPGFGRIAAQTAKQVILQKIREKEKEAIISDFKLKIGTIVNGMVLRFAGPNVIVDVGKTEAIMPPSEQIPNEKYHLNQRLVIYILEIKEIAREPGNRSKIAVFSTQAGIDPVGSCVGQKGVRVQAIIQEFGGLEKIDIIQWQETPKNYITQALSPAKELKVEVDEEEKVAHVFVAPEELSLAIGKEGQNVRLASKLTGYRIEIEGKEELSKAPKEEEKPSEEAQPKAQEPAAKSKDKNLAKEASEVSDLAEKVGEEKEEDLGEEAKEVAQSVEALKEEIQAKTEEKPEDKNE